MDDALLGYLLTKAVERDGLAAVERQVGAYAYLRARMADEPPGVARRRRAEAQTRLRALLIPSRVGRDGIDVLTDNHGSDSGAT